MVVLINDLRESAREVNPNKGERAGCRRNATGWGVCVAATGGCRSLGGRPRSGPRTGAARHIVTRSTSSMVVRPMATFDQPSSRRDTMPCWSATWRISVPVARVTTSDSISSLRVMTS